MRPKKIVVGVTVGMSALSFLRGQLDWFQRNGWEVLLTANPDKNAEMAAFREDVRLAAIPMQREISPLKDMKSLWKWVLLLRSEKPAAVNVGTPKASLLGIAGAFLTRVPKRLYVVRGLRLEGTGSRSMFAILWCIEKLTMTLATDVLFVSKSLAHKAKDLQLTPVNKSWLIGEGSSNGVHAESVNSVVSKTDIEELRTYLGLEPSDFVVGCIGRITVDKGVDLLVDAIQSTDLDKHIRVLFVGGVEDPELAEKLNNVGNKAVIVEWTSEPWRYLSVIDVLCLPTLREGFPNVVLEAASIGIPSIVTNATGAIDSVVDGVTGRILTGRDPGELVSVMNELILNPAEIKRLGENSKKRVLSDFKPENIWNGLLEIVEDRENKVFARKFRSTIDAK